IDSEGKSFSRSWTDKKGDDLYDLREDVRIVLADKQIRTTISVGLFSISFKSMVPIYRGDEFLGVFEVISHFNSIEQKLQKSGYESLMLVDKRFKPQLTRNITKTFIDGYYVANFEPNLSLVEKMGAMDIERLILDSELYTRYSDSHIITINTVFNAQSEPIGYFVVFAPNPYSQSEIDTLMMVQTLYGIIALIVLTFIFLLLLDKQKFIQKFKDHSYNVKLIGILGSFFVLFVVSLYLFTEYEKRSKINEHLEKNSIEKQKIYNQIIDKYEDVSQLLFESYIDTEQVKKILQQKDRESVRSELIAHLSSVYSKYQKYNLKQLHFHTPQNISLLRFHRLQKYGDDLSKIRPTVAYVNKHKKPTSGFEEGAIYNGYRFVYPLFDADKYLGSVEVSFSVLYILEELVQNFDYKADLFMKKSITDAKLDADERDNYVQSVFEEFYNEKQIKQKLQLSHNHIALCAKDPQKLAQINDKMMENKIFSDYFCDKKEVITFLPLQNPITQKFIGYIAVAKPDGYIENKANNTLFTFVMLVLLAGVGLIFSYREMLSKRKMQELNESLETEVKKQVNELSQKDKLLQEQAKLAAMGEMISAIAHQWRQPLNALNINIQNLDDDYEDGLINEQFVSEFIDKQTTTIRFMSKTIDDFRDFFKTDKEKTVFNIQEVIVNVEHLVAAQLKNHNIEIVIKGDDFAVSGYKNEMQQVILNIISNSKDAMIEKTTGGQIIVYLDAANKKVKICDGGGGVNEEILGRIFEPYFTTKEQGKGTGIGLHMSRIIVVEHMGGNIKAYNSDRGLCMEVSFGDRA
ncbi:MAG: cache domain-containing protein, partial [Campylobacterota bacterium]